MSKMGDLRSREDKNTLFTVLSNHRRRYLLHACQQANGEATLGDIAEQVAAWEYNKPIDELTSTERKRVYTSLQQHHLDKLLEAGLIEVERDVIKTTEKGKSIRVYLDVVTEGTIPWSLYYLGLAVVGGFSLLIVYYDLLPEPISALWIGAAFVLLLGGSAVVHHMQIQDVLLEDTTGPPESL